jgi:hypothetical protein
MEQCKILFAISVYFYTALSTIYSRPFSYLVFHLTSSYTSCSSFFPLLAHFYSSSSLISFTDHGHRARANSSNHVRLLLLLQVNKYQKECSVIGRLQILGCDYLLSSLFYLLLTSSLRSSLGLAGGRKWKQCCRCIPRVLEFSLHPDVVNQHMERGGGGDW